VDKIFRDKIKNIRDDFNKVLVLFKWIVEVLLFSDNNMAGKGRGINGFIMLPLIRDMYHQEFISKFFEIFCTFTILISPYQKELQSM